jgi:hypothetical protein
MISWAEDEGTGDTCTQVDDVVEDDDGFERSTGKRKEVAI